MTNKTLSPDEIAVAIADLKNKVAELFDNCKADAMQQIDYMQSGKFVNIAADHIDSGQWYVTPKLFMLAYADNIKWRYNPSWVDKHRTTKTIIKNYLRHMRG